MKLTSREVWWLSVILWLLIAVWMYANYAHNLWDIIVEQEKTIVTYERKYWDFEKAEKTFVKIDELVKEHKKQTDIYNSSLEKGLKKIQEMQLKNFNQLKQDDTN